MSKSVMKREAVQKGYRMEVKRLADGRWLVMAFDNGHVCPAVNDTVEMAWWRAVGGLDAH